MGQRRHRVFCLFQPRQQRRFQPLEDCLGAFRAQGGIAAPSGDDAFAVFAKLDGLVGRAGGRFEEILGQFGNQRDALFQLAPQVVGVGAHQGRQLCKAGIAARQAVGLRVVQHLQAMFGFAVGAVGGGQRGRAVLRDPAGGGQTAKPGNGAAHPQRQVAPAGDQLAGLGEKLDLANAAGGQLDIAALQRQRPAQPAMFADAQAHVVGVLYGGKVQMPPPDKGRQALQEVGAAGDVAGRRPRLDIGAAFPGAANAFVIAFGRLHGHADRRGRRVGSEPQVGAKDIAVGIDARQGCHGAAGGADEGGAHVEIGVGVVAAFVEQADQVDVRGIVELGRAHLAHGQHRHAQAGGAVIGAGAGETATPDLGRHRVAQCAVDGHVGQPGQGAGDRFQRPDAAQIGQRRQQGHAPAYLAQTGRQPVGGQRARRVQQGVAGAFGPGVQRGGQPRGLGPDQAGQKWAGPGGATDQVGQRAAGVGQDGQCLGPARGFECVGNAGYPA